LSPLRRRGSGVLFGGVVPEPPSEDRLSQEIAAAIRGMARDHPANQRAIARQRGIPLLITLLQPKHLPSRSNLPDKPQLLRQKSSVKLQGGQAGWSTLRQKSRVDKDQPAAGGSTPPMKLTRAITLSKMQLGGNAGSGQQAGGDTEPQDAVEREAAGALWSLAEDEGNRQLIADYGGVPLLLDLLQAGSQAAQETAAGALGSMAASLHVCETISAASPVSAFGRVLENGSDGAKRQVVIALRRLAIDVPANQRTVAEEVVRVLSSDVLEDDEHAAELEQAARLADELALNPSARDVMAEVGAIPQLVKQVEMGTDTASGHAANALSLIALACTEYRSQVTNELISARHRVDDPRKRQRVGRALSDMNGDEDDTESQEAVGMAILMFRLHTRD